MTCLIVLFYEVYLYEFVISNDFYKIVLYIIHHKYDNLLCSHHLLNKKLVDLHYPFISIRLFEINYHF